MQYHDRPGGRTPALIDDDDTESEMNDMPLPDLHPTAPEALIHELRKAFAGLWETTEHLEIGSVLSRLLAEGRASDVLFALQAVAAK